MTAIAFRWDGESMAPVNRYAAKQADAAFVVGEVYWLDELQARSMNSHRHYFAAINDAWQSLPEDQAERWPTPEHLRKFALIRCGYSVSRQIVCASKAEAQRVAGVVRPMNEYAVVTVREAVVTVYEAQSQSTKAMGKVEFQKSKQAVLDYVAGLIGVEPKTLAANAGMAA